MREYRHATTVYIYMTCTFSECSNSLQWLRVQHFYFYPFYISCYHWKPLMYSFPSHHTYKVPTMLLFKVVTWERKKEKKRSRSSIFPYSRAQDDRGLCVLTLTMLGSVMAGWSSKRGGIHKRRLKKSTSQTIDNKFHLTSHGTWHIYGCLKEMQVCWPSITQTVHSSRGMEHAIYVGKANFSWS